MLVLDDNMLKLAKMQETLLKVTVHNRQENLNKYKDIVIEIDKQAFMSLLDELKQVDNHNQTLEDELRFMELVSNYYNQLNELQFGFKKVCELYGDNELKLSDLSQIDIGYINNRKSIIEGYLINLKNIDINQKKLESLNKTLIEEEKNKMLLSKRLLDYEDILRKNFINSEGRIVVDGNLQYISVVSEYKKLDYDFKLLLVNKELLDELLSIISADRLEMDEKYRTAEICYNSNPNSSSKNILDDISKEFFKVRYRLTMLKILELLSNDYDNYEQFKDKREKILDLIKYRVICLKNLGEHISIDPFARTKIEEQLNATVSFSDNSRKISKIKKEILELSNLVDEMIVQNSDYRIQLNETKDLIIDTVSMSDIVSFVEVPKDISLEKKEVSDNQVVSIKELPVEFNKSKVKQKTRSVIKRVSQMISSTEREIIKKKIDIVNPELVIVSEPLNILDNFEESNIQTEEGTEDNILEVPWIGSVLLPEVPQDEEITDLKENPVLDIVPKEIDDLNSKMVSTSYNASIFETIDPFEQMPLFVDRIDDTLPIINENIFVVDVDENLKLDEDENEELEFPIVNELNIEENMDDNDSDIFWVTQSDSGNSLDDNKVELSFDDQINALLLDEDNSKIKKLVA